MLKNITREIHKERKSVFTPVPEDDDAPAQAEEREPMSNLYAPTKGGYKNVMSEQSYGRRASKLPSVSTRVRRGKK